MISYFFKRFFLGFFFFYAFGFFAQSQDNSYKFQDESLSIEQRVNDLISHLTLQEKAMQMMHDSPEIKRLDIPEYNWWNEALHGVGRSGNATVFPQAIGMGATFDDELLLRVATAISDEARANHNTAIENGYRL